MKIKEVTFHMGNDFKASYECEHCHAIDKGWMGYDDANYHENVIPHFHCKVCGKDRAGNVKNVEAA